MQLEGRQRKLLLTGGAGYIGSHCCVELLKEDYELIIVDNLSNSSIESIKRIELISGKSVHFHKVDLLDLPALKSVFATHKSIDVVIHFAGLKAVGESHEKSLDYYKVNVVGSINLFECMREFGVNKLVYSSSATVYGNPSKVPITEDMTIQPTSPYGWTKSMTEQIIQDISNSLKWNSVILRYFNPVGAHSSGLLGEDPLGRPNNLMPLVAQVAIGRIDSLTIYGTDYETKDGTGLRDYIHITDLCRGHLAAIDNIFRIKGPSTKVYNLGTGVAYSVKEMISMFEAISGRLIRVKEGSRRSGDVSILLADPSKAKDELGWKAEYSLECMCRDLWNWQSNNPNGLRTSLKE